MRPIVLCVLTIAVVAAIGGQSNAALITVEGGVNEVFLAPSARDSQSFTSLSTPSVAQLTGGPGEFAISTIGLADVGPFLDLSVGVSLSSTAFATAGEQVVFRPNSALYYSIIAGIPGSSGDHELFDHTLMIYLPATGVLMSNRKYSFNTTATAINGNLSGVATLKFSEQLINTDTVSTPEPSSMALMGVAITAFGGLRQLRRRSKAKACVSDVPGI